MSTSKRRTRLSVTLDSDLLAAVDACMRERGTTTRSAIVGEALRLWIARERERAIEAQHAPPETPAEATEFASWRAMRDAAAQRLFRPR